MADLTAQNCADTLVPIVTELPQRHVLELDVIGLVLSYARLVPVLPYAYVGTL
jgi:hypothetical protein